MTVFQLIHASFITERGNYMRTNQIYIARDGKSGMHVLVRILAIDDIGRDYLPIDPDDFNKLMMAKSMFSIGRNIPPGAIARVLMETRSPAALHPITPQVRFQVWVKEITPPSSSTTSFPIFRRPISPTDGSNVPVSETAPPLSPRNSAPAHLCLSQVYRGRTSIAR